MAPWFRSPGRAAASRPVKPLPNQPASSRPGTTNGAIDLMRPWQRRVATPYVAVLDKEDIRIVNAIPELTAHADRSLLIVEDDKPFLERLSRAMETRGFTVTSCDSVSDGLAQIGRAAPAVAEPQIHHGEGRRGLDVVSALKRKRPDAR